MRQCEVISRLFGATAPIRVDVRQFREEIDLALIDIKMKRSKYCLYLPACSYTESF
ncbi:hypothetical protein V8F44DRAFT_610948 [Aspergillus fumigatus]